MKIFNSCKFIKPKKIISYFIFNKTSLKNYVDRDEFYAPGTPYVKEITDKIYPKIRKLEHTLTLDAAQKDFDYIHELVNQNQLEEAFVKSNILLNDLSTLFKDDITIKYTIYSMLADIQLKRKEYESALEKYEIAYDYITYAPDREEYSKNIIELIFSTAYCYDKLNDMSMMISTYNKLLEDEILNVKENNQKVYFELNYNLANLHFKIKNYEQAVKFLKESLCFINNYENKESLMIGIFDSLGKAYQNLNMENEFNDSLMNALELMEKTSTYNAEVYLNLISFYLKKNQFINFKNHALKLNELIDKNLIQIEPKSKIEFYGLVYENFNKNDLKSGIEFLNKKINSIKDINLHIDKEFQQVLKDSYLELFNICEKHLTLVKDILSEEVLCSYIVNYSEMNLIPITTNTKIILEEYEKVIKTVEIFTFDNSSNKEQVKAVLNNMIINLEILNLKVEDIEEKINK